MTNWGDDQKIDELNKVWKDATAREDEFVRGKRGLKYPRDLKGNLFYGRKKSRGMPDHNAFGP